MTTHAIAARLPSLGEIATSWLKSLRHSDIAASRVTPDETRARRDFVCEMMDRPSGGMISETDVQTMMLVYPCRF